VALRALTETTGPDTAVVPTVVGMARTTAESRIRAAGFLALVEHGSAAGPDEHVVSQQPEPGARLSRGSVVGLTVTRRPG
jgi:beta-lactam-binding protein with PASTA domain